LQTALLGRRPSFPLAVIFLGPSDEEEKVVNGLLEGCSLALRGYTQGKAPILSFRGLGKHFTRLGTYSDICSNMTNIHRNKKDLSFANFLTMYIWKGYCRKLKKNFNALINMG
jgi:hypothetical protein